jgi:hypothetical protein
MLLGDFQFELLYIGYSLGYIPKKLGDFFVSYGHSGWHMDKYGQTLQWQI